MITTNDFTRIGNDTNGNPRYVCKYVCLLTEAEKKTDLLIFPMSVRLRGKTVSGNYKIKSFIAHNPFDYLFQLALWRANTIGGKKHGLNEIVFQSYNLADTVNSINEL